jgi:hypothetical protein
MQKNLSEDEARGMTVNERIFLSGQMDEFDKAVAQRNVPELERILRSVYLQPDTIRANIEQVLGSTDGTV